MKFQHRHTHAFLLALFAGLAPAATLADTKVEIIRDEWGVPHVYADEVYGLYAGYGYAVAQDRLFQMEMSRRSVLGTVAEVLGPEHLAYDLRTRADFDHDDIRAQIEALAPQERDVLRGYAAGYNKRLAEVLADRDNLMPRQFIDFGIEPSSWTEFDVAMIYVGTMAGRFSHYSGELANAKVLAQLEKTHGPEKAAELFDQMFWLEDPKAPTTVPSEAGESGAGETDAGDQAVRSGALQDGTLKTGVGSFAHLLGQDLPSDDERPRASNIWIVGPEKTTDGSTILLNGPQFGDFNPAYVYSIGLHGAGFDLTGSTPFAVPNVLFGTNGQIAWGATAGPLDVNDYVRLELDPENPARYKRNGEWQQMASRAETFKVKGQPDINTVVYESDYGVVSRIDPVSNSAYAFQRSWKGKEIQTLMAWVNSTKAQNHEEWMAQAGQVATTINWYYADKNGNIGYVSPGYLPLRASGHDQRVPAMGDGTQDWTGIRDFAEVPKAYNPEQGWIANWNNRSARGEVANFEATPWGASDRVDEINVRLAAKDKLTPQEVWDLNREVSFLDINARALLPFLLEAAEGLPADDPRSALIAELADWDGQMIRSQDGRASSPAVAIFRSWVDVMVQDVLMDDQPAIDPKVNYSRISRPVQVLRNAILGDEAGVPQTYDFFNGADKAEVMLAALSTTAAALTAEYGPDISEWRQELPRHEFRTSNYLGIPQAGEDEALAVGTSMNRGTQNNMVTFKDGAVSFCAVAPPGQSGFISPSGEKSPHYEDQMALYENFECRPQALLEADVRKTAKDTLILTFE